MRNIFLILLVSLLLPIPSFAQERDGEARELYLKASSMIRDEQYKDAKVLLEQILSEYGDTEIALKADEKLNEILGKIEAASLPTIPGCYIKKLSGDLVKLEKEPLINAGYSGKEIATIKDYLVAQGNPVRLILFLNSPTVTADEVESFIIFNPNQANISDVGWNYVSKNDGYLVDLPESAKGKSAYYILYPTWSDNSTDGTTVKSDEVIKQKIAEGMYEIKFPKSYFPQRNTLFALIDGSGYAFPFLLAPTRVMILKATYLDTWNLTDNGITDVSNAIKEIPNNSELYYILSILHYRRGEFDDAIIATQKGSKIANSEISNYLNSISEYAQIAKEFTLIENSVRNGDEEQGGLTSRLQEILMKNQKLHQAHFLLANIYFDLKEFELASEQGNKAIYSIDQLKDEKGVYALLEKYSKDSKKKYEKFTQNADCEGLLSVIRINYIDGASDANEGLKMCDKAKKLNDDNPYVYDVKAQIYNKIGKSKDAKKQAKKALKVAQKQTPNNVQYFEEQLSKYN